MPVKFQNQSEYGRQYEYGVDPNDPPLPEFYKPPSQTKVISQKKAVTEEPPLQHKKHTTVSTDDMAHEYASFEPPLQRKKKPIVPHGSNPTKFVENGKELWQSGEEYVLLGNQDKFTTNVKYKAKPLHVSQEPPKIPIEEVVTPDAPRHAPAPRVVVDTGAPQQPKKYESLKQQNGHQVPKQKSSPPKPTHSVAEPKDRSRPRERKSTKATQIQEPVKAMNGDIPAEDRAPSDYALKYKAGVAPPRGIGPKRLSEYQRQFEWKKGADSSPLLDAEQVVYKSSTQLVPRKAKFSKTTEYKKQFQQWEPSADPVAVKPGGKPSVTKARMPRSKSVGAISPNKREPAGKEKLVSESDPRLVQESLNPLHFHFPHGPFKQYSSEYAANFASPQVFEYEQGAWKGANPPHLQAEKVKPKDTKTSEPRKKTSKPRRSSSPQPKPSNEGLSHQVASSSLPSNWYAEVLELRKRAEEYKRRSHGTHFSRQHMAQLLAQQAEMWDTASTSSVLSALSLETPHVVDRSPKIVASKKHSPTKANTSAPPAGKKTAWGDDRVPVSSRNGEGSVVSTSIAANFDDYTVRSDLSDAPALEDIDGSEMSSDVTPIGRIPTSKMNQDGLRHHLDRTTPINGALLSSPPRGQGAAKSKHGKRRTSSQDSVASEASTIVTPAQHKQPATNGTKKTNSSQTSQSVNNLKKPIYGMPTRDAHALLDESASTDRPLATDYVHSPVKGNHNRDKFPGIAVPSTIQEAGGSTYDAPKAKTSTGKRLKSSGNEVTLADIPPRPAAEDDILSLSARSIASSCSFASEVLDRAKSRRDEFWGVPGHA